MSSPLFIALITIASGVTGACLVCLPWLVGAHWKAARAEADDTWRDQGPWLIRLIALMLPELIGVVQKRLPGPTHNALLRKLQEAGLQYSITPAEFFATRIVCVVLALVLGIVLLVVVRPFEPNVLYATVGLLMLAWFYPAIWLRDVSARRKQAIEKDFPFFLDVVVLTMKAGLAFPAAIEQSTSRLPEGPIRHEFYRLIREVRTGSSRTDALQSLAKRVRLASISNFVAVVAQADESGGSLTKALQEQARQRRRERFQRAEKLANQAPVKLLFPLVAFLFPVTFMIIGYPLYKQLSSSGFLG
jgi:tight adherence protein C